MPQLATAIDLPDYCVAVQVHHGVFRPRVNTTAGTIDRTIGSQHLTFRHVVDLTVILNDLPQDNRHVDIHIGREGTPLIVVTAIERTLVEIAGSRVVNQSGCSTVVFHIRIKNIAGG